MIDFSEFIGTTYSPFEFCLYFDEKIMSPRDDFIREYCYKEYEDCPDYLFGNQNLEKAQEYIKTCIIFHLYNTTNKNAL
jgi:hypothetical protein